MDLDSYIQTHRVEWKRLEDASGGGSRNLANRPGEEIAEIIRLYLRASSHLAEVQTRYHDPALEGYLNALVARAHAAIYFARPASARSFGRLFGERYRDAIRRTRPHIAVVAGLLVLVALATDLWVATSPEARAGLLPPGAREAIRQAGRGASPFDFNPAALSTLILQNNVQVAFLAFALGITLGIGTVLVVVQNATFIGLLAGGFQAAGRAWTFWSLVLPHGFLEIIAICIAGGAGLRMGWAVVEPGDRPRVAALGEEARDAVLVVVGVIPAFVVAATIEGFVTGRTGLPLLEVLIGAVVALGYLALLFSPTRPARDRPRSRAAPGP
ncbi:MAG: stage II sporulation protein M [Actinomycetota bacterium]